VNPSGLEHLHLLGFERKLLAKTKQSQLQRLNGESPDTPAYNERQALARALIGLRAVWGLLAIPLVGLGLALQLTVGLWCLIPYAGVILCIGMNIWRRQQSNRFMIGNETT
jgi:hypothetical protein